MISAKLDLKEIDIASEIQERWTRSGMDPTGKRPACLRNQGSVTSSRPETEYLYD